MVPINHLPKIFSEIVIEKYLLRVAVLRKFVQKYPGVHQ
jgi:hypothetical protein